LGGLFLPPKSYLTR